MKKILSSLRNKVWSRAIIIIIASFSIYLFRGYATILFGFGPNRPVIFVSDHRVDFGRLRPLQESVKIVTITNQGSSDLRLEDPTATCGCQKPEIDRKKLAPGESAKLTLRQQAGTANGPFQHVVSIKCNDSESPESIIYLNGYVSKQIVVNPEPLVFGTMRPGESRTRFVEVSSDDGLRFQITHKMGSMNTSVKAMMNQPSTIHRLEVTLNAPKSCGPIHETFVINTDIPGLQPLDIPVVGNVSGIIKAAPSALSLGTIFGFHQATRKILLKGDGSPIRIDSIQPPPGGGWKIDYHIDDKNKNNTILPITLTIRVPASPGLIDVKMDIVASFSNGEHEILQIPLSGVIVQKPDEKP